MVETITHAIKGIDYTGLTGSSDTSSRDMLHMGNDIAERDLRRRRRARERRGQCTTCGQPLFKKYGILGNKKLMINNDLAYNGRCLRCHPLPAGGLPPTQAVAAAGAADKTYATMLDSRFFKRITTRTQDGFMYEAYEAVYARSTMVLFSRKTKTPLAALTLKAEDVGCLSMLTGRPSPHGATEPYFQGMLNMTDQVFDFTISNLSDKGMVNFNVLHTPNRVSSVDPGPAYGVNQVNELHQNQSYTIEADQRNNRQMILKGKTQRVTNFWTGQAMEVSVTVKESETKEEKPSGLYFYLSVVPDRICKELVEKFAEGTIWKVVPGFVRRFTAPLLPPPFTSLQHPSLVRGSASFFRSVEAVLNPTHSSMVCSESTASAPHELLWCPPNRSSLLEDSEDFEGEDDDEGNPHLMPPSFPPMQGAASATSSWIHQQDEEDKSHNNHKIKNTTNKNENSNSNVHDNSKNNNKKEEVGYVVPVESASMGSVDSGAPFFQSVRMGDIGGASSAPSSSWAEFDVADFEAKCSMVCAFETGAPSGRSVFEDFEGKGDDELVPPFLSQAYTSVSPPLESLPRVGSPPRVESPSILNGDGFDPEDFEQRPRPSIASTTISFSSQLGAAAATSSLIQKWDEENKSHNNRHSKNTTNKNKNSNSNVHENSENNDKKEEAGYVAPVEVGSTQAAELQYGSHVNVVSGYTGHDYAYEHSSEPTVLCMSIWTDMQFLALPKNEDIESELNQEIEEWIKNKGQQLIESLNAIYKSETCVIDLESEADTIICTCGHQCIHHSNAGKNLRRCPLCRSPITAFVKADGIMVE